jgi:hypothetical protein
MPTALPLKLPRFRRVLAYSRRRSLPPLMFLAALPAYAQAAGADPWDNAVTVLSTAAPTFSPTSMPSRNSRCSRPICPRNMATLPTSREHRHRGSAAQIESAMASLRIPIHSAGSI